MTRARVVHGATLVDADGVVEQGWLVAKAGVLTAVGAGEDWRDLAPPDAEIRDARGRRVVPGFVDLHSHGGGGHSYDAGTSAEIIAGLTAHRRHGTTASMVSFVAAPIEVLAERLRLVAALADVDPRLLGAHLEGPFLASGRRGAHLAEELVPPTAEAVDRLLAAGVPRLVTIAPELPGALEAIERFAAAGATVAVGHTEADYDTVREAFDRGARVLTHAFNAMPGIGHRAPGPVAAAVDDPRVTIELILDGLHVHTAVARMLFTLAPGRVALVTDAMAAAGSADGDYRLGSQNVAVRAGVAMLRGTGTLAGSTLTQDAALGRAIVELGLEPSVAVAALTSVPAAALGLDDSRGRLRPGFAAELVVLDDDWRAVAVLDGRSVQGVG